MQDDQVDEETDLDATARASIERACERLVIEYCHRVDLHGGRGVADLFAPDGSAEMLGIRSEGRDQIAKMFGGIDGSTVTRHVCSTVAIDVVTNERATGVSYLTLYQGPNEGSGTARLRGPFAVGQYHDDFVRTAEGWRIAHRRVEVGFRVGSAPSS